MQKTKITFLAFCLFALTLSSCSLFKKNCNCPDVRKSKGVAQTEQLKDKG